MLDYRLLFERSPARLLVLAPDPGGYTILGASDAYLEATLTTRDIVSRPLFTVFPDDPADPAANGEQNLNASLVRALESRSTDVMPVQKYAIRDRSGRFLERHWTPVNAPVVTSDGAVVALIHRVEDVTPLVHEGEILAGEAAQLRHEILARGQELARANAALLESLEQRRKIVAIVGHDLRGPLSSIRMGIDKLKRSFHDLGSLPPRVLGILQASSARMQELLDDLDDYTRAQLDGVLPVSRQHVNLRAICEEVSHAAQLAHPDRVVELEPGGNVDAYVDPKRKRQLLGNLIDNALAHGDERRPVRVSLKSTTGYHVITVSNEGEPIPETVIPMLFQPFQRGQGTGTAQRRSHMGLGLFIVKEIAQAHEGSVEVKSTPQGTHFSVYIPVR